MLRLRGQKNIFLLAALLAVVFCLCAAACRPASQSAVTPDGNGVVSVSAGDSLPDLEELRSYDSLVTFDFGTREPDLDYLHELRTIFPDCDIRFEMQIGGKKYGADTVSIVSPALTADDVKKLSALKELQTVDARGSACVKELKLYASEHPECIVCYSETVFGEEVSNLDTYLDLSDKRVRIDQLKSVLDDHPNLTDVNLIGCSLDNSEKYDLHASYPGITFYWNIYYGDETFRSTDKKLDFTRLYFNGLDDLIQLTGCFMDPEYVDVSTHGYENSEMERISSLYPDTLFVWMIRVSSMGVRTDVEVFDGTGIKGKLSSSQLRDLRYCRNLKAIDLSRQKVTDLSFLSDLSELRVLLLGNNSVTDLSPLAGLENLQYIELYNNGITDISALSGHQNLKDVNLTGNQIGDMSPLSSCPLLQYVHLSRNPCSEDAAQQDSLRSALPDTLFVFDESSATRGWNNTEHSLIVDRTIVSRHYYDIDQGIVGID